MQILWTCHKSQTHERERDRNVQLCCEKITSSEHALGLHDITTNITVTVIIYIFNITRVTHAYTTTADRPNMTTTSSPVRRVRYYTVVGRVLHDENTDLIIR